MTDQMTIPGILNERVTRGSAVRNIALALSGAIVIAIAAQVAIPIPFSPVPMTLQPMAVLLVGAALGLRRGAASAAAYLAMGAAGLPVFAEGHGGALWLVSATAGYLLSYPFAAGVVGYLSERGATRRFVTAFAAMLAGMGIIYAGGASWLAVVAGPKAALTLGILPFLAADVVKCVLAALLVPQAQKLITRE